VTRPQRRGAGTIIPPETTEWRTFRDEPGGPSLHDPVGGDPVELQVARDMARRALPVLPVLVAVSAAIWGVAGPLSCLFAVAIVLANFALSAFILMRAARISLAVMMGAALFGYIGRLALITVAVLLVHGQWWVAIVPLGLTLVITHLGLLLWETKHVSVSLAYPGLKPQTKGR
jgi:hypothetical protein